MRDDGEMTAVAAGLGRAAVIAWRIDLASPGATRRDHGALLPNRTVGVGVTPIPLMRRPRLLVAQTAQGRAVPDRPRRPRLTRLAALEALR